MTLFDDSEKLVLRQVLVCLFHIEGDFVDSADSGEVKRLEEYWNLLIPDSSVD